VNFRYSIELNRCAVVFVNLPVDHQHTMPIL
jgi:hypothetical protein